MPRYEERSEEINERLLMMGSLFGTTYLDFASTEADGASHFFPDSGTGETRLIIDRQLKINYPPLQ